MSGWPNTLKYFMWSYQVHFGISLQLKAESIFKEIGSNLEPTILMVGILKDADSHRSKVCFEPEKFDYYGVELFNDLDKVAEARYRESNDSKMFYSGDGQQELMNGRHLANHRRMLIRRLLDERSNENIHYVSDSQFVHGYDIYIVARFEKKNHDNYCHLFRKSLTEEYGLTLSRSLLHSTIGFFLQDAENLLHIPDAGKNSSSDLRSHSEYLRSGAKRFMTSIASRGKKYLGINSFFQICETISTSTYENEIVTGHLLIAPKEHEALEIVLTLSEPFRFSEYRKTIKLLRITDVDICVITDSEFVYGLGKINLPHYKVESETLMIVAFTGFHAWEVNHHNSRLLRMINGDPQASDTILTLEKLHSDALRIFSSIEQEESVLLLKLIEVAISVKIGTQIIICENAKSESERLKARCFKVVPKKLTTSELVRLMRIDGGIMIDQHLNLYAYGVLLDGTVVKKGDSSRGSRYNSALTYYESYESTSPTMVVVISDDGMLSVIPDLRPQIDHSQVTKAISVMQTQGDPETYLHEKFVETQEWLNTHRFYLREAECDQLNDLNKKISEHTLRSRNMFFSYGEYIVNDDMNDSYYLAGTF